MLLPLGCTICFLVPARAKLCRAVGPAVSAGRARKCPHAARAAAARHQQPALSRRTGLLGSLDSGEAAVDAAHHVGDVVDGLLDPPEPLVESLLCGGVERAAPEQRTAAGGHPRLAAGLVRRRAGRRADGAQMCLLVINE